MVRHGGCLGLGLAAMGTQQNGNLFLIISCFSLLIEKKDSYNYFLSFFRYLRTIEIQFVSR